VLDRLRERIEYVRTGGHTVRFHTKRTLLVDTVGHHSFNVAWLAHFLGVHLEQVERYTLLLAALEHDLPEQEVGDLPAPAKRGMSHIFPDFRAKWGEMEDEIQRGMGFGYSAALSDEGRRVLKVCDALDGAFFCCHERALGNTTMVECYLNFVSYVEEVINHRNPPETAALQMVKETWEKVNAS
jgi:5'-deoxynucleotidase YfbR-like HD superfamily hydrolase